MNQVWNGLRRGDAIRKVGGNPDRISDAIRPKGAHHAYLELHIEQGGNLDRARVPIGIVEGIVAIERSVATITGFANHAGTTPMAERQDALLAASHLALAVREIVTSEPGRQVGTVGQFDVSPNAANVIPGGVRMTIELRDLSVDKLTRLKAEISARAAKIATATKTTIQIAPLSSNPPAFATPALQDVIARASGSARL
jgi:beta-ureidopropionase / N-carbamoyl-L-amino-acid hydrolase